MEPLVGMVRRENHQNPNGEDGFSIWACVQVPDEDPAWFCIHSTSPGNVANWLDHDASWADMEDPGPIAYTPADEHDRVNMPPSATWDGMTQQEADAMVHLRAQPSWRYIPSVQVLEAYRLGRKTAQDEAKAQESKKPLLG